MTTTSQQSFSVDSAKAAAAAQELNSWVASFLSSPGSDNAALAQELTSPPRDWTGPVELRFEELHRLAGPPDQPTLNRFDGEDLDTVDEMGDSLDDGWEPPPLIVTFRDQQYVVEDGNHRIEGLRRDGRDRWWAVISCEDRPSDEPTAEDLAAQLAEVLRRGELTVAVAESLTGGSLSATLAAAEESSNWYRGGVVAYSSEVKHDLLDVPPGPVVSEPSAAAMAEGVGRLLGADLSLSVTGVGGPDPQDDQPPGTVWMGLHDGRDGTTTTELHHFEGEPEEIVAATCRGAIAWLLDRCRSAGRLDAAATP
ncbi:MAG: CinA family protein [Microthrixaceae bacterium]